MGAVHCFSSTNTKKTPNTKRLILNLLENFYDIKKFKGFLCGEVLVFTYRTYFFKNKFVFFSGKLQKLLFGDGSEECEEYQSLIKETCPR